MLANMPEWLLKFFVIVMPVIACVVIVGGTIWGIIKVIKTKSGSLKRAVLLSVFSILIFVLSSINMGWIRFILIMLALPFIHPIIVFITNMIMAKYTDESKNMRIFNLLFCITFVMTYVFLPDCGDIGEMYFFFGQIHSDSLSHIAFGVSFIALCGHIALFIAQIVLAVKIKKCRRQISETEL